MSNTAYSPPSVIQPFITGIALRFKGLRPLLMLRAYFDESGHPNDHRTMVMGGCIASLEKWERLENLWKAELNDAGAVKNGQPYFHMYEFEHSQPPFDWSDDKHRRVLARLLDIMDVHIDAYMGACTTAPVGATLLAHAYPLDEKHRSYTSCFMFSVEATERLTALYGEETTQLVFAEQEEFGTQAKIHYDHCRKTFPKLYRRLEGLTFAPYLKTVQLHTADLVAYAFKRHYQLLQLGNYRGYFPWDRLRNKPGIFLGIESNIDWSVPVRLPRPCVG